MNGPDYAHMTGREIRLLCRAGSFDQPTAGAARGFVQVNLVILSGAAAGEFEEFCRLNPKPCPLLEVTVPGTWEPVNMAPGADVRTDLPRYRVFRKGTCVDTPTSLVAHCRDSSGGGGLVSFLIGCSFTFENALLSAGLPVRHLEEGRNVPMYRTNIPCNPAGAFAGPMVVSMRPMTLSQATLAAEVTAQLPKVHGAPVHLGDPAALGIGDLSRPDYGDAVTIRPDEIPVFWACGVTPMEAILRAAPDLAMTHEPGHMLVTDVSDRSLHISPLTRGD